MVCRLAGAIVTLALEVCDNAISKPYVENPSLGPPELAEISSPSMFFVIGRYEVARVKRLIIDHLSRTGRFGRSQITSLLMVVERLHLKIDALMARLPIQSILEKGYIFSRLKYASSLTHKRLYEG